MWSALIQLSSKLFLIPVIEGSMSVKPDFYRFPSARRPEPGRFWITKVLNLVQYPSEQA